MAGAEQYWRVAPRGAWRVARALAGGSLLAAAMGATAASGAPAAGNFSLPGAQTPHGRGEYQLLVGELALNRGDMKRAAEAYLDAAEAVHDPALAQRATQVAMAADRPDLAYRAAQIWAVAGRADADAQQAAVRLALVNDDASGLARFAPALVASAAGQRAGYERLVDTLSGRPDEADIAVAALQQLAGQHPDSAAAQYALGRVALGYNKLSIAGPAVRRAALLAPKWHDAVMLQATLDVRQGRFQAARRRVDRLAGAARQRAHDHAVLARQLVRAGKTADARDEFRRAVSLDARYAEARFGLGLVSLASGADAAAAQQFDWLYQHADHRADAAFYLGVIAEQRGHSARALRWYGHVDGGDHVLDAALRSATLNYARGHRTAVRKRLHALIQQYPHATARIRAVEGQLLIRGDKPHQALAAYDDGLKQSPHDSDLLYSRALVYEQLGRIRDAEHDLQSILARHPDNAEALNALGYMLTNHSTEYGRAERYIRRSLAQEPRNPAVLDSLGWVEYKQGDLGAARKHLEEAYKASGDPEIAAHLGEVRWKQGDHDAARRLWHRARATHPHNATLRRTIKRLTS